MKTQLIAAATVAAFALPLFARAQSTCTPPGPSYYVNCGAAAGGTGSSESPFNSLAQATQAMRGSLTKVTVVSGMCSGLNLGAADSGDTFQAGATGANISGPPVQVHRAQNVTIEGFVFQNIPSGQWGGTINLDSPYGSWSGIDSNLTIRWNTFLNCEGACIAGAANNSLIDSNTANGMGGNQTGHPMGLATMSGLNNVLSHNLVENSQGAGFRIMRASSSTQLVFNLLRNVNQNKFDSGAIYIRDVTRTATGIQVLNNAVVGNGPISNRDKCIYLDDGTSNVTVTGNLCAGGMFGVFFHGGSNNVATGNFLQAGNGTYAGAFQTKEAAGFSWGTSTPMTGNVLANNTIHAPPGTPPRALYRFIEMSRAAMPNTPGHVLSSAPMNMPLQASLGPLPSNCFRPRAVTSPAPFSQGGPHEAW
jgi:hypothetical protein